MDSMDTSCRTFLIRSTCFRTVVKGLLTLNLIFFAQFSYATPIYFETIALSDDLVPGDYFGWGAGVNDNGDVVYSVNRADGSSIYVKDANTGLSPPYGSGGGSFWGTPEISNAGDVAYSGDNKVSINNQIVVQTGDFVPSTPNNPAGSQTFLNVDALFNRGLSDGGETVFRANTSNGEIGLWRVDQGGITTVSVIGDVAPGSGGATFADIGSNAMNSNGDLVFIATLDGASSTQGIWRQTSGGVVERVDINGLTLVNPATNMPELVPLDGLDFSGHLAVDGNGNPIFQGTATVGGQSYYGLWKMNGTTAEIVPGGGGTNMVANISGQVAYQIQNFAANGLNNELWAEDIMGGLNLVAMTGQLLEVGLGDFRTINYINFAPQGLSDLGYIAFGASFEDGSGGVFMASFDYPVGGSPVPLPSTAVLLALGLVVMRRLGWQ